jgi:hypothetical protein
MTTMAMACFSKILFTFFAPVHITNWHHRRRFMASGKENTVSYNFRGFYIG